MTITTRSQAASARLRNARGSLRRVLEKPPQTDVGRAVGRRPRPAGGSALSFAQQRLWFLAELYPELSVYNIATALAVRGSLDVAALVRVLGRMVDRHESLRTTFAVADEQPVQRVRPAGPARLPIVDLAGLGGAARRERDLLALREAMTCFDLERGPLLRATLLAIGERESCVLITLHHIVSDGWSLGVLIREMMAFYREAVGGGPADLPELPVQYADFAAWQRESLSGEKLAKHLDYWRRQLTGRPTFLQLPADRRRPPVQAFRGRRHRLAFSRELSQALEEASRKRRTTLFMLLMAAFHTLLWRWSGEGDLVVGTPFANRTRNELKGLVGFFVNILPVAARVDGRESFAALLQRLREATLEAGQHQELPFDKLVEGLDLERAESHGPLVQVVFAFQNLDLPDLELPGLEMEILEVDPPTSMFDVTLNLRPSPQGLRGWLEYGTDLFDATTIARAAARYRILLQGIAAGLDTAVADLPFVAAGERHQLLAEWNDVRTAFATGTVLALFEEQVARRPEAEAVVEGALRWTYSELDARAERLARALRRRGVGPESRVAVCLGRSASEVVALLAVVKAGAAFVPLAPSSPGERLRFMLEDAGVEVLLTSTAALGCLTTGVETLYLDRLAEPPDPGRREGPPPAATPANLVYVIYTSGSSGRPKGVAVENRSLVHLIAWHQRAFAVTAEDRACLISGPAFDAAVWELWPYLTAGASVRVPAAEVRQDPGALRDWLLAEEITLAFAATPLAEALLELPWPADAALRLLLTGGDRLRRAPPAGLPFTLVNNYGPTEGTVVATSGALAPAGRASAAPDIGRGIDDVTLAVLDPSLARVALGTPGQLHVGGAGVGRGYLGRGAQTADRFIPDPWGAEPGARMYRTGDRVRHLADGTIDFLGRIDFQVKLRGFRIELGEIEAVLTAHPRVERCVVLARGEGFEERRLVAYVVGAGGAAPDPLALRDDLMKSLPAYMVPAAIVALDELPVTPNGKLDRRALPAPSAEGGWESAYEAPATATEWQLAEIWSELTGAAKVGRQADFFDLGGHSLLATRLIARVRERWRAELTVRQVFRTPRLSEFAAVLDAAARPAAELEAGGLRRADRGRRVPLSFAQERLWFLDQLQPLSAAYNIPAAVELSGRLDLAALAASFARLRERHEVLRTRFPSHEGQPFQEISTERGVPLALIDLTGLESGLRESELGRLREVSGAYPFDLDLGPLVRVWVVALAAREHAALLTLHHIIADGWSMEILVRELGALYTASSAGRPAALPPLPVQYADFAVWQRRWLAGAELERQLGYWRSRLSGAASLLELPADRPRPPVLSPRGRSLTRTLPPELAAGVAALAPDAGATLFMKLLTAFKALIYRWTGTADVVVGAPIAGRDRREVEGLIGLFVNTLVLRTDLAGAPRFDEALGRVRETAVGAFGHPDMPFEKLVEELNPQRNRSHAPLCQMLFTVDPIASGASALQGLEMKLLPVEARTAKFDLTLRVREDLQSLTWIYSVDLFEETTVERYARHYRTLLGEVAADPRRRLAEISLLSAGERAQLVGEWNDSARRESGAPCLAELFESWVERCPERDAVVFGGPPEESLTYAELNRRANRLAHALGARGIGPEVPVGLYVERSIELVVGLWGILKAGGFCAPMAADTPVRRVVDIARRTRMPVLLSRSRRAAEVSAAGLGPETEVLGLDGCPELAGREPENPKSGARPANPACVIHTSGSTGAPKGVVVEHRQLLHFVGNLVRLTEIAPGWRHALVQPPSVDSSLSTLLPPFLTGGTLHVISEETALDPGGLGDHMTRHAVDFLKIAPSHLRALQDSGAGGRIFPRRCLVFGGEVSYQDWAEVLAREVGPVLLFGNYGPTETTVGCSMYRVRTRRRHSCVTVPLGHPFENIRAYVLDRRLGPQPIAVAGELYIAGAGVTRGYLGRPGLSAERYLPDPLAGLPGDRMYRSGDVVRRLPDGHLEYLGRSDHQVKIRGFRIELGEIEATLRRHPSLADAAVGAFADPGGGRHLIAYVVPAPGSTLDADLVESDLKATLPDYMVPASFIEMEALPRLAHGKLDRKALAALEPPERVPAAGFVAPRDDLERQLAEMWEETFDLRPIGVRNNFFDLGGHSLLAVRLMARFRRRFGDRLALGHLFEHPTIERLANVLRRGRPQRSRRVVVPIQPAGDRPPLFFVHPVGGNVFCYVDLAARLGPDQPFYGLQSPAHRGEGVPAAVEDMARLYVRELRRVQPAGPYHVGGWSFGGVVAFEIARQLTAVGEWVRRLFLLDSAVPTAELRRRGDDPLSVLKAFAGDFLALAEDGGGGHGAELSSLEELASELLGAGDGGPGHGRLESLFERAQSLGVLSADVSVPQLVDLYGTFRRNFTALSRYEVRPAAGSLVLFQAAEPPADLPAGYSRDWRGLTSGGTHVETIPGNHYTILREPHVKVLADRLEALLGHAGPGKTGELVTADAALNGTF